MCNRNKERELTQLWYGAKLYFNLLPINIEIKRLNLNIINWAKECKRHDSFYKDDLFIFSSHLSSCAVRLYSIDEILNSKRFTNYYDYWKNKQKGKKYFNKSQTNEIIHCVLRNLISHNEEEDKDNEKRSYKYLMRYYWKLTFLEIKSGILNVSNNIRSDLNNINISVDKF
jgi:hypothetical protein